MADKHGHIDLTYQAISALTGWPLDLLKQAITELTQPDPDSRSPGEDGRRLVLIDPGNRQWGWRVVNHGTYRERARLKAKSEREIASGSNAARMDDRRSPPETAGDRQEPPPTPSPNANANAGEDRPVAGFDRFWEAYPKKRKRKTAEEIWNRKRLDSRAEELLADVRERSKSDRRWLEGFIPDPTTYLNGERWNDEKEPPKRDNATPRRELPDAFDVARRRSG